jgi:acetate kinase
LGEQSRDVGGRVCGGLDYGGISIDPGRNAAAGGDAPALLSADAAAVQVWVVPTDEEAQIARELYDLFG